MDVTIKLCEVIIVLHSKASFHPLGVLDILSFDTDWKVYT